MKKNSEKKDEGADKIENFIKIIRRGAKSHNSTFLSVDPGIRNVGWCLMCFDDCSIVNFGLISNNAKEDQFGNDYRVVKISNEIKKLILTYRPAFAVVEKITFTKGRYSFSESILLKAVGVISLAILEENIPIFEMVNAKAQKVLLEKADNRKSNKELMKKYVLKNLPAHVLSNKCINKNKFDTSDAIFIAMAFRAACENYINKNLQKDL